MDFYDSIRYIARSESRLIHPYKKESELDEDDANIGRKLPAFKISYKNYVYTATPLNRDPQHDNVDRLTFLCNYLNQYVLPIVSSDVTGIYRIELHDSYTYLENASEYNNVISFGKHNNTHKVAVVPDPYMCSGMTLDIVSKHDPILWNNKLDKTFFAGSTTGNRNPILNQRLKVAEWSLQYNDIIAKITNIVQMKVDDVIKAYPVLSEMTSKPYAHEHHFEYKYLMNIAGNTACWSRVPLILGSKSMMIDVKSEEPIDHTWYHPLMINGIHYMGTESCNCEDIIKTINVAKAYESLSKQIVRNANSLTNMLFADDKVHKIYWKEFLENVVRS